jgi:dihydrodipicolinate synthase/N-acetylneuraminate lyase
VVIALAEHPNLIGIKESSGDVEKVRLMVERTRHIQRTATVTETFAAVTPRMLKQAASASSGEVVPAAALGQPSSSAVQVVSGLKTRPKEVGFQVLVGAAQKLEPSLGAGAVGAILAFADAAPTACFEIYAAFKEGDTGLAREKQQKIAAAATRVVSELSIPGVKYAMELNGYFGGPVRLPLLSLTADLKAEVERLMADIKN